MAGTGAAAPCRLDPRPAPHTTASQPQPPSPIVILPAADGFIVVPVDISGTVPRALLAAPLGGALGQRGPCLRRNVGAMAAALLVSACHAPPTVVTWPATLVGAVWLAVAPFHAAAAASLHRPPSTAWETLRAIPSDNPLYQLAALAMATIASLVPRSLPDVPITAPESADALPACARTWAWQQAEHARSARELCAVLTAHGLHEWAATVHPALPYGDIPKAMRGRLFPALDFARRPFASDSLYFDPPHTMAPNPAPLRPYAALSPPPATPADVLTPAGQAAVARFHASHEHEMAAAAATGTFTHRHTPTTVVARSQLRGDVEIRVWDCRAGAGLPPTPFHHEREPIPHTLDASAFDAAVGPSFPDQALVHGLRYGVHLHMTMPPHVVLQPNLLSVVHLLPSLDRELAELLAQGRVTLHKTCPFYPLHVSPIGSTEKKNGTFRMTYDASAPHHPCPDADGVLPISVNDAIDMHDDRGTGKSWPRECKPDIRNARNDLCILDQAARLLRTRVYCASDDCKKWYYQFPVHPSFWPRMVTAVYTDGCLQYCVQKVMVFGISVGSNVAQRYSNAWMSIVRKEFDAEEAPILSAMMVDPSVPAPARAWMRTRAALSVSTGRNQLRLYALMTFTDDPVLFAVGPERFARLLVCWARVAARLGVILASPDKRHAGQFLTWIGATIVTALGIVAIPAAKVASAAAALQRILRGEPCTSQALREVAGLLEHLRAIIDLDRTYGYGIHNSSAAGADPGSIVTPTPALLASARRWITLLETLTAVTYAPRAERSLILGARPGDAVRIGLYTDASLLGFGAYAAGFYLAVPLPPGHSVHINVLELYAVIIAVLTILPLLPASSVDLYCDNTSVVQALAKASAKSPALQHAQLQLHALPQWRALVTQDATLRYVFSQANPLADAASRQRHDVLRLFAAQTRIRVSQVPVPADVLAMVWAGLAEHGARDLPPFPTTSPSKPVHGSRPSGGVPRRNPPSPTNGVRFGEAPHPGPRSEAGPPRSQRKDPGTATRGPPPAAGPSASPDGLPLPSATVLLASPAVEGECVLCVDFDDMQFLDQRAAEDLATHAHWLGYSIRGLYWALPYNVFIASRSGVSKRLGLTTDPPALWTELREGADANVAFREWPLFAWYASRPLSAGSPLVAGDGISNLGPLDDPEFARAAAARRGTWLATYVRNHFDSMAEGPRALVHAVINADEPDDVTDADMQRAVAALPGILAPDHPATTNLRLALDSPASGVTAALAPILRPAPAARSRTPTARTPPAPAPAAQRSKTTARPSTAHNSRPPPPPTNQLPPAPLTDHQRAATLLLVAFGWLTERVSAALVAYAAEHGPTEITRPPFKDLAKWLDENFLDMESEYTDACTSPVPAEMPHLIPDTISVRIGNRTNGDHALTVRRALYIVSHGAPPPHAGRHLPPPPPGVVAGTHDLRRHLRRRPHSPTPKEASPTTGPHALLRSPTQHRQRRDPKGAPPHGRPRTRLAASRIRHQPHLPEPLQPNPFRRPARGRPARQRYTPPTRRLPRCLPRRSASVRPPLHPPSPLQPRRSPSHPPPPPRFLRRLPRFRSRPRSHLLPQTRTAPTHCRASSSRLHAHETARGPPILAASTTRPSASGPRSAPLTASPRNVPPRPRPLRPGARRQIWSSPSSCTPTATPARAPTAPSHRAPPPP